MADVLGTASSFMPKLGGVGNILKWAGLGVLVGGVLVAGVYFLILYLRYNKKIVLFRKIRNTVIPSNHYTACFQRISLTGDYWCKVKQANKIIPRPKIAMGKDTYWFFEREDGEWINFCLKDIDEVMKDAGVYYLDEDMRLQRIGIQKHLELRYKKTSFWDKYGQTIMWLLFVVIVTVCLIILFDRLNGTTDAISGLADAVKKMADAVSDQTARSSSGVVPVNMSLGG